jgi:hypothetical protein
VKACGAEEEGKFLVNIFEDTIWSFPNKKEVKLSNRG